MYTSFIFLCVRTSFLCILAVLLSLRAVFTVLGSRSYFDRLGYESHGFSANLLIADVYF